MQSEIAGKTIAPLLSLSEIEARLLKGETVRRSDLLPILFNIHGAPFSLENFPQFRALYDTKYAPNLIFMCGRQVGKSLSENDLCIMGDGSLRPIKDVEVGDRISSLDAKYKSCVRRVTGKFDHGVLPLYRVTTALGNVHNITREHRIRTLEDHTQLADLVVGSRVASLKQAGEFMGVPVARRRIMLTAYILGDGSCWRKNSTSFTSACPEVQGEIDSLTGWKYSPSHGSATIRTYRVPTADDIIAQLAEDGLIGKRSAGKTIPSWVFQLSREDTCLFLSRLWATDGSVKLYASGPSITYCSVSERLAYETASLLRKLGILAAIRKKEAGYRKAGVYKRCQDAYELRVTGHDSQAAFLRDIIVPGRPAVQPVDVPRNSNRDTVPIEIHATLQRLFAGATYNRSGRSLRDVGLRVKPKYPLSTNKLDSYIQYAEEEGLGTRPECELLRDLRDSDVYWDKIVSIEYVGEFQAYDIEVEDTHVFAVSNGLVTHNSVNLARYETLNCIQIPHFQVLYVAPLQSQAHRYSSLYLREALTSCLVARELQNSRNAKPDSGPIMKAVGHQAFLNNAGIQMTYAKTSADRARGIYADEIDCDELQDHLVDNVAVIMQSLTQSKWGLRRYTGTAKTLDNTIEHYWQRSSMSEWVVKCTACNHWNIPNKDGKIYEMVRAQGPSCVKCGKRLNVSKGVWVAAHPDRVNWFPGYHIPQVVVPEIADNPQKWYELVDKVGTLPEATVYQEIFGISSSLGARLITQEDINKRSILASPDELQKKLKDYVCTVSGVDWGVAEQTSFTVHTVIGVRRDGKIHVLWAKRYVGFDTDSLLKDIAQTHRFYKCQLLCADHGVGFAQNILLSHRFGLAVVQMQYSRQKQLLSYNAVADKHPRWIVDKVTALELLFFAIRYGHIFFPPQADFKKFTDDLLSPFQVTTAAVGIESVSFVRNPNSADDFCHALCFAVLGAIRLVGGSLLDLVPKGAMGADTADVRVPTTSAI